MSTRTPLPEIQARLSRLGVGEATGAIALFVALVAISSLGG